MYKYNKDDEDSDDEKDTDSDSDSNSEKEDGGAPHTRVFAPRGVIARMRLHFPIVLYQRQHMRLAGHFCAVRAVADMLRGVCLTS